MEFRSNRLYFREFTEEDYGLYSKTFSNDQVMRYAWIDCMKDEGELRQVFSDILKNNNIKEGRKEYYFAVFTAEEEVYIGMGLVIVSFKGELPICGEIGYFLLPEFWGKGYATEIAGKMTAFCFDNLMLHRAIASCNANNYKSENIMKKLGMQKEGEFRQARYKNGIWDNELKYGILKDEWIKNS